MLLHRYGALLFGCALVFIQGDAVELGHARRVIDIDLGPAGAGESAREMKAPIISAAIGHDGAEQLVSGRQLMFSQVLSAAQVCLVQIGVGKVSLIEVGVVEAGAI